VARRALTATTLAATAALLLTACGSGGDTSPDDIKGADTGSPTASASASTSGASNVKRPVVTLPGSFQAEFQNWTNSDPDLQTALNDGRERLRASYAAIIAGNPQYDALAFYSGTSAMSTGSAWVKGYKGLTIIGKVTVSGAQIAYVGQSKSRATLFYCVDESKGYSKDLKTGATEGTPKGESPKVQYRTSLAKQADGVWKTMAVETQPGAC
jgi:hypothetical protein